MDLQLETVNGTRVVRYTTYLAFTNGILGGKYQSILSVFIFSLPEFLHLLECIANGISGNIGPICFECQLDKLIFRTDNGYSHNEQVVSISQFMNHADKIVNSSQDIEQTMQNLTL